MKLTALLQTTALPSLAQPVIVGTAIVYLLIVAGIGVWATRRTRTARDFFVAGRGLGLWALGLSSMAATLSGFAFIGGPGLVYSLGLGAVFIILPISVTTSLSGWVLAKRLRLLGEVRDLLTIPDALAARYRSPLIQGLAAAAIVIAIVGYMATNLLALGIVVDAIFGTGLTLGVWIGAAIVVAYSTSGGMVAGVYTDVFQGTVMAIASLAVFVFTLRIGSGAQGLAQSIMAADPGFLAPWGKLTPLAALSFFFVFGMGALGQPHVVHKFYMLKDPRRLRWYPLVATLTTVMGLLLFVSVGLAVKALVVRGELAPLARADNATPVFLLRFAPLLLTAIVFAGVVAAIMSTVNSFMNVGAAALSHDLPRAFGRAPARELRSGRLWTVVLSLLATWMATRSGAVVAFLGVFGWGLFASTLVPALALGLNWSGASRQGAIASILTGLAVTLIFESMAYLRIFTFPAGVTATALALVTSLLVFIGVSWATGNGDMDADVRAVMEA